MHYAQDLPFFNKCTIQKGDKASTFGSLANFMEKTPKYKRNQGNISEMSMSDVGYNVQKLKGKISLSGELR